MAKKRLNHREVKALLKLAGINFAKDFHELSSSDATLLAEYAKLAGYRKSKNAPGSTARMYFQLLERL